MYLAKRISLDRLTCLYLLIVTYLSFAEFNSLPNDKFLDWFKLNALADDDMKVTEKKMKFVLKTLENIVGKCWLPACSPFPTIFSKGLIFKVVKSWDCGLCGEELIFHNCMCFISNNGWFC